MKLSKLSIISSISLIVVATVIAVICNMVTPDNKETINIVYETEVYQPEVTLKPTEEETSQTDVTTSKIKETTTKETTAKATTTKQSTTKRVVKETTTKPNKVTTTKQNKTTTTQPQKTETRGSLDFDSDDALMLHKIAIAEAGGGSVESMALVMLVVLNRTYDSRFPDSIYGVIHQKNQFSPITNGSYAKAQPNEKSEKAMELVLSGWDGSQGALYFESCSGSSWQSRNLTFLFEKEGHKFYK